MHTSANKTLNTARSRLLQAWRALARRVGRRGRGRAASTSGRRARVVVGCVLLAIFVFLHTQVHDGNAARRLEVLSQLSALKRIDVRWDAGAVRARVDPAGSGEPIVRGEDVAVMQYALASALEHASDAKLRAKIDELIKAYAEKVDVVTRLQRASSDSRSALEAAMRADAAVAKLVRGEWRNFASRERLVAAENVVSRILAQAQQYQYGPTPATRAVLAGSVADLGRAHSLPRPVQAALHRLESDIHQLLLLKPLEQRLVARVAALETGPRTDDLIGVFQRQVDESLARSNRYRNALVVYTVALALLLGLVGMRARARYRRLRKRYRDQTDALSAARRAGSHDDMDVIEADIIEGPRHSRANAP